MKDKKGTKVRSTSSTKLTGSRTASVGAQNGSNSSQTSLNAFFSKVEPTVSLLSFSAAAAKPIQPKDNVGSSKNRGASTLARTVVPNTSKSVVRSTVAPAAKASTVAPMKASTTVPVGATSEDASTSQKLTSKQMMVRDVGRNGNDKSSRKESAIVHSKDGSSVKTAWPQSSRPNSSDLRPATVLDQESKRKINLDYPRPSVVVPLSPGPLPISNTPSPEPQPAAPAVIHIEDTQTNRGNQPNCDSMLHQIVTSELSANNVPPVPVHAPTSAPPLDAELIMLDSSLSSPVKRTRRSLTPRKDGGDRSSGAFNERSPEDSIYWARTPPTEALKRINKITTLRSREDEVASIIARLDSSNSKTTSSSTQAGTSRRTKMMEVLERLGQARDDPDLSTPSPVTTLGGTQDEGASSLVRRRRRLLGDKTPIISSPLSPNRISRGQVHRMMTQQSSTHAKDGSLDVDAGSFSRPLLTRRGQASGSRGSNDRVALEIFHPVGLSQQDAETTGLPRADTPPKSNVQGSGVSLQRSPLKTPTRTTQLARSAKLPVETSPGEFDDLLDDLEMDEDMLEELTQYELEVAAQSSSSTITSASSHLSNISSATSVEPCLTRASSDGSATSIRRAVSHIQLQPVSATESSSAKVSPPNIAAPKVPSPAKGGVEDDDFGEFGHFDNLGDDFTFEDDEDLPTARTRQREKYLRFRTARVDDCSSVHANPTLGRCKVLTVMERGNNSEHVVQLYGHWADTSVSSGDIIHIVDSLVVSPGVYQITSHQGFIIVRPDNLISTSVLSNSFTCLRKSVLNTRVAASSYDLTMPLVHGNMLHELFQYCLCAGNFTTEFIHDKISELARAFVRDLALIGETVDTAKASLEEFILPMQSWANRFVRPTPANDGIVQDQSNHLTNSGRQLCINKVLDVEENIWSPMFGLKGKIDASVQVKVLQSDGKMHTLTVPFELKTGRSSQIVAHRAQTILYTLLMTDRYEVDVQYGLLFYLKTGDFIRVPAVRDEVRAIMMQRNEMALYDDTRLDLPPMLKNERTCRYCYSLSSCTVMHKLTEQGTATTAGMADSSSSRGDSGTASIFDDKTSHLTNAHGEFYKTWDEMLTLEQGGMFRFRSLIWSVLAKERQAQGQCFSNMVLVDPDSRARRGSLVAGAISTEDSSKFSQHRYRFRVNQPIQGPSQSRLSQHSKEQSSLLNSSITVGDPIVVSSENGHYALAVGFVLEMSFTELLVGLDRPLLGPPMPLEGFHATEHQVYRGLMEISEDTRQTQLVTENDYYAHIDKNKITFRIDRDEMSAGLARIRNNLLTLFRANEDDGDWKRRSLIVDLEPPKFFTDRQEEPHHQQLKKGIAVPGLLNSDQLHAVEKVLAAQDYALILGMPGTGKTTTIMHIIKALVAQGKSVLLTSYTHSAVDNVLLKLKGSVDFVRLGNPEKVDYGIREFVPDFTRPPLNTIEAINQFYDKCQVVGTTCLGTGDPMFAKKRFDYCIVDEASQITLPVCLGPIRLANIFVLVGDHHQLPPLVKNAEAKSKGYDVSLFKLLSDKHPEAVASLAHQYRMNKDIMHLSNMLIYDNKLQCATEKVANSRLHVPHLQRGLEHCHLAASGAMLDRSKKVADPHVCPRLHDPQHGACWLAKVLDPTHSVIFMDTDAIPAREVRFGELVQNPIEAKLVVELTEALIRSGIAEKDIGIISVYRAQLKVLSRLFKSSRRGTASQQQWSHMAMDIQTVDRYQGTDKDCVIISLVRSNDDQAVGQLLKDWRRINVAFTRAKKKLVVFGSRSTLQGSPIFDRFLKVMEDQDWIMTLPAMAHEHHPGLLTAQQSVIAARSFHQTGSRLELVDEDDDEVEGGGGEDDKAAAAAGEDANSNQENVSPNVLLGKRPQQDDGGGEGREAGASRRTKVFHASMEAVTKRYPVVRHLLDDLS